MNDSAVAQMLWTPGSGLPVALPLGWTSNEESAQVNRESGQSGGTNTPRPLSAENQPKPPKRVSRLALRRAADELGARDMAVLRFVAQHRYLSTGQLQRFVFTDHATEDSAARTARRVLSRLRTWLLLRPLERRVGGVRAGSTATIWQLTPGGARLLRDDGSTHRTHEPSARFLTHCLAIGDVHLLLRGLASGYGIERVDVQVEAASWRRYTGDGGEPRWLQPDLAATLHTADYDDRWFIEVDLGTESLPTLLKKCGQYETYRATGIEQAERAVFPLVLWVFTKPERAERLEHAVLRSPRLTPGLYRYAAPETIEPLLIGGTP